MSRSATSSHGSTALLVSCASIIAYTYIGFPLILLARARFRPRPLARADSFTWPTVSVVVAAHNEEAVIAEKTAGLLASDYPPQLLDVIVVSDGSTDGTVQKVRGLGDPRVQCLDLERVGKATALDRAIEMASGEILVFTDANSMFAVNALKELIGPFADPHVGGVAGDQRYMPTSDGVGERSYWNFDRILKRAASAAGNTISATGAIYAVRRSLCPTVPVGVTDDFAISTAVICQGQRLVFAPEAAAYEPVASGDRVEFARKTRVMTRGLRGVWLRRELMNPRRHGFYAVQVFTHKLLRRLMVLPLLGVLVASLIGARRSRPLFVAAAGQAVFYAAGASGLAVRRSTLKNSRLLALPAYFCMVNAATMVAMWNIVRGKRIDRWHGERNAPTASSAAT